MKSIHLLVALIVVFSVHSQTRTIHNFVFSDSLYHLNEVISDNTYEEDFAPGLGIMALIMVMFILICTGIGIALTVAFLLVLFGLTVGGILSTSILVGLHNRSFEKGFKTFVILANTVAGILLGASGMCILNRIQHWFDMQKAVFGGLVFGFFAGLFLGFLMYHVIRNLTAFLKRRLD